MTATKPAGSWAWLINPYTGALSPKRHWIRAGAAWPACNGCRRGAVQLDVEQYVDRIPDTCRTCRRLKSRDA